LKKRSKKLLLIKEKNLRNCAILGLLFVMTACGHPMNITDFSTTSPPFDPVAFWTGHVTSWGVIEDRSGAPTETIETDCLGTPGTDGLHLIQTLRESDGTVRHRDWHLRRTSPNHFTATANDMVGPALGEASGRAFHWDWVWATAPGNPLKNVTMHQWMYLMPDGTMVNRTTITKLSITVAQVTERFAKAP
jgi:hypothetical protein